MKKIFIVLVLLLFGCSIGYDSSVNNLEMFISDYCDNYELVNKGIIFEKEIPKIGYYAIVKVEQDGEEYLLMSFQDVGTKKIPTGFSGTGPIFYEEDYHIFNNEDKDFGNGKNYYLYVVNNKVFNAIYDGKALDITRQKYYLDKEEKYISSFLIITDKGKELDKALLKYE